MKRIYYDIKKVVRSHYGEVDLFIFYCTKFILSTGFYKSIIQGNLIVQLNVFLYAISVADDKKEFFYT